MSYFRSLNLLVVSWQIPPRRFNIFSSQELGGELPEGHSNKSLRIHFMSKDGWARGENFYGSE